MILPIVYVAKMEYTIIATFFYIIQSIAQIYNSLSTFMFCIFAYPLVTQLEEIRKQVDGTSLMLTEYNGLLRACSIRHSKICWAVAKLDDYFADILLLFVSNVFVQTTSLAFFTIRDFDQEWRDTTIGRGTELVVYFYAICTMAEMMKKKVTFLNNI